MDLFKDQMFRKLLNFTALLLYAFLGVLSPAHGKERSYAFSLGTKIGFLYGTSYEISYNGSGSSQYISELQWRTAPLWFAGLSMEYGPRDPFYKTGFFGNLEVKVGLPGTTGTIEDRDWMSPGTLTHFSLHDNRTKAAVFADIGGGLSMPLVDRLILRLSLGFSYMYLKHEARDGYTQYDPAGTSTYIPWDPAWPKVPLQGLGIGYSQHWLIFHPGLELAFRLNRFTFTGAIFASPLVLCFTADNHYRRSPPFLVEADLTGEWFLEPKASILFALNSRCTMGVTASYRYIDGARGDLTLYEYGSAGTDVSKGFDIVGAAYKAFEGALTFSYTL